MSFSTQSENRRLKLSRYKTLNNKYLKVRLKPEISVIVVVHDRRNFIKECINSVLSQTIEKDLYEIIVVKNYEDSGIDLYLSSNDVKVINTCEVAVGAKLALGIIASQGRIISFLEDDDLYLPHKLETIIKKFNSVAINYYHHQVNFINYAGQSIENEFLYEGKNQVISRPLDIREFQEAGKYWLYFNMSSISVKRSTLTSRLHDLSSVVKSPDAFVFFICADEGGILILDCEILSNYRIHKNSSSNKKISNLPEFISFRKSWVLSNIQEGMILAASIRNSEWSMPLRYDILREKVTAYLLGYHEMAIKKDEMLELFRIMIRNSFNIKERVDQLYHIFFILLSLLSKKNVQKIYSLRLYKHHRSKII